MTETAVTRLHKALDPWIPGAVEDVVTVPRVDLLNVLQHAERLCEDSPNTDHHACQYCGNTICSHCGGADPAGCEDRHNFEDHCTDCIGQCPSCRERCVA